MNKAFLNQILKRKNDKKTLIIAGSVFVFILLLFVLVIASKHKQIHQTQNTKNTAKIEPFAQIAEFGKSATGEAIGDLQTTQTQSSEQIKSLESQNKKLSTQLESITKQMSDQNTDGSGNKKSMPDNSKNPTSIFPKNTPLNQTASPQVVNLSNQSMPQNPSNNLGNVNSLNALGRPVAASSPAQIPGNGISDFSFQYNDDSGTQISEQKCTPKNCVLPGTFARAVLLGAADANASVNGQSNTTPILFRILGRGILPNGFHSHLKGCFVVGEVFGDISSERGEVKLAQISCVLNGKTITKSINGTAYFMGKEGIRGRAIMRNGPLLWNAGVAGMLSGLAQGVQQAQQTQSISPLGTTTTVASGRIAASMGAGGVQSAANTLANYYIKRADQYHPIIELNAGTIVNLVFLNQFLLTPNDSTKGALVTKSPSSAYWQSNNSQSSQSSGGNLNGYSYGQSVSANQVGAVQNQINQVGQDE